MPKHLKLLLVLLLCAALTKVVLASPAPAPLLQSPASGALNVDPDPTLSWRWVDDLISNGSFETGLSPGWYAGGPDPNTWQIVTATTNTFGMGFRWATTYMPNSAPSTAQLIQDLYVPADATSATLQWQELIVNLWPGPPTQPIGRLRVMLFQGGGFVAMLEDVYGREPQFLNHTWVSRSTNLLAYAGQNLQLVFQADGYSPLTSPNWFADVDGVSFTCEHAADTPEFQVYLSRTATFRSTNLVGSTTALSFAGAVLNPSTTYFWRVGAVRDGVTNYSTTASFKTGLRAKQQLTPLGRTDTGVRLSFPTHSNRYYTIEQADGLQPPVYWYDILSAGPGTGAPMEVEVPFPLNDAAFWRVRVSP